MKWTRQQRSVLNSIWLVVVFVLIHGKGIAHPGSHVDVWARIGPHLDIRITLFLKDVMATEGIELSANGGHISLETAHRSLEQFGDGLRKMIVIYDADGHQLNSEIAEKPHWSVPPGGVDLAADSGLRLTWKLRYPWQLHQQSFSIRHRFVEHHLQPVSGAVELPAASGIATPRSQCSIGPSNRRRYSASSASYDSPAHTGSIRGGNATQSYSSYCAI